MSWLHRISLPWWRIVRLINNITAQILHAQLVLTRPEQSKIRSCFKRKRRKKEKRKKVENWKKQYVENFKSFRRALLVLIDPLCVTFAPLWFTSLFYLVDTLCTGRTDIICLVTGYKSDWLTGWLVDWLIDLQRSCGGTGCSWSCKVVEACLKLCLL